MTTMEDLGYMHKSGIISVVCDVDKIAPHAQFYSCGQDDGVKIWTKNDGKYDSKEFKLVGKVHGAIAVHKDIYLGQEVTDEFTGVPKHAVVYYGQNNGARSDPLMEFSLQVTALAISFDGSRIVAGSQDYVMKLVHRKPNQADWCRDKKELDGLPVSIIFSPTGEDVAVATSDGYVKVYTTDDRLTEKGQYRVNRGFNVIESDSSRMHCAFSTVQQTLYIPSDDGIIVVSTKDYTIERRLRPSSQEEFSICALSVDMRFLAGYTLEGHIYIYDTDKFDLINTITLQHGSIKIMSMLFDPMVNNLKGNFDLLMVDEFGKLMMAAEATKNHELVDDGFDAFGLDGDTEGAFGENDEDFDIGKIKDDYGFTQKHGQVLQKIPTEIMESLEILKKPILIANNFQPPQSFVSGSTPIKNGENFFKYNSVGVIKQHREDETLHLLVEFHDITTHPAIMLDNTKTKFYIGDLNGTVVALASKNTLCVLILNTFDVDSKRWTVDMPENEEISNIAVSDEFVAVYTSEKYVRIFTVCGTQRSVFSVADPLVTMVASNTCLVLSTFNGVTVQFADSFEPKYSAEIYSVNALFGSPNVVSKLRSVPIALSPEAKLNWISFSIGGQICTMDSDYVVRRLTSSSCWIPIFEGSKVLKSEEHAIWPILVSDCEGELLEPSIRYLMCKTNSFPLPSKKLIPFTEKWDIPLCDKQSGKTTLEHDLIRNEIIYSAAKLANSLGKHNTQDMAKLAKDHLSICLRLFNNAMIANKENRACEFANMTHTDQGIQMMCNFAAKKGKSTLKNKMEEFGLSKESILESRSKELYSEEVVLAPVRAVKLKRRPQTAPTVKKPVDTEDYGLALSKPLRTFEEEEVLEVRAKKQRVTEVSMVDSPDVQNKSLNVDWDVVLPVTPAGFNPFKKKADVTQKLTHPSSDEFFSSMTSSATPVVMKTKSKEPVKKQKAKQTQSKLSFSASTSSGKENDSLDSMTLSSKATAYELWVKDNEDSLRTEYEGDEAELSMFMMTRYRTGVTPEVKKRYKEMADSQSMDCS